MTRPVRRRTLRGAIIAVSLAATGWTPTIADAHHQGCYTYGEVVGLDVIRTCSYEAQTDTQYVYVATPATWRVWVTRTNQAGEPAEEILLQGEGPPAGPPPAFHPIPGETVNVSMDFWCPPTFNPCGTVGVIGAGLEQGHP